MPVQQHKHLCNINLYTEINYICTLYRFLIVYSFTFNIHQRRNIVYDITYRVKVDLFRNKKYYAIY